ncbi:DEAD/DEAH box helicase [Mycetocola tolaasinivorans]|uniref:DEAD/DEAH box helicase n=1 Tax=Mycetocola tolaasinivorans TaxID=76635 RepID=A0A3L6ZW50_9MICO|nr:DEAD/DEAH box helicase [Mycetocola tolaasinivorans]RLP72233.1 DEAD/DEAH box helicase [Mycetocola tolaasinivorans]
MSETTFASLGVPAPLVKVLAADGKENAFPIQVDTLADTLGGRDVLGRGKTGSGKTLAFSIPLVARLATELAGGNRRPGRPLGLVLAPTRELATQIAAVINPLAEAYGLKTTTIFGGINQTRQVNALNAGVDIVVACPGRLEDLMKQGHVRLDAVEITVIDEADHMADLGFLPVVTRLLSATPENGQRLLFSATLDNGVDKLVRRFLHNEVLHSVDEATSHVAAMTHHVFSINSLEGKKDLITTLASGQSKRILFTRTKHQAKKLAKQLTSQGIPAVDLHGNLSQPQRDRNLAAFGSTGPEGVRVLVATDVAARGVHVDGVELVVHVDPPMEHKAYLHRSGRTARAGTEGDVVTICLPSQTDDLKKIMKKAAITVDFQQVDADSAAVTELVGPVAAFVKPAPLAPVQQQGGGGQSQGANALRKRAIREGRGDRPGGGQRKAQQGGGQRSEGGRGGQRSEGGRGQGGQRTEGGRGQGGQGGQRAGQGAGNGGRGQGGGAQRSGQGGAGQARRGESGGGRGGNTRGGSSAMYSTSSDGGNSRGRGNGPRRASAPSGY